MNQDAPLEFAFSQEDFNKVRDTIYRKAGIKLADSKDSLVYSRLARRLRALSLDSFDDYLIYLKRTPQEEEFFINALTTNLTSFYREPHHFLELSRYLRGNPRTRTIWCAASSTGEEPYSIAMTVAETFNTFDHPVTIIASDIDSNALEKARQGIYKYDVTTKLSADQCQRFFHRGKGRQSGMVRIVPEIRNKVIFRRINLADETWPVRGPVDIIFCRNVMIYFDKQTQLTILKKMVDLLPAKGIYFAGHSENFNAASHLVKPIGKTIYQPVKGGLDGQSL